MAGTLLLSGCGDADGGSGSAVGGSGSGMISDLSFCDVKGLTRPLRQTTILLDARSIKKGADAAQFAAENGTVRDLILSIADPDKATASGTTAYRERVSITVIPADGSPSVMAFTGCVPGLSPEELQKAKEADDWEFVLGDQAVKLDDRKESFRRNLIGGLTAAAAKADGSAGSEEGPIAASKFFASLRNSRKIFQSDEYAQRFIIFSDASGLLAEAKQEADGEAAAPTQRQLGLAAGSAAGGDFGLSEIYIILPDGKAPVNREMLEGYFLAQGAWLAAYSSGKVSTVSPAPIRLWNLIGEVDYPSRKEDIRVRIGDDGTGKLTMSWLTLIGDPTNRSTPMSGRIDCVSPEKCSISSDDVGFAQIWSVALGGDPEFENDMPFGGMRQFSFDLTNNKLEGKVFDPSVILSDDGKNFVMIRAGLR